MAHEENEPMNDSIARGLAQSAAGEVHDLGDFTQYAEGEPINLGLVLADIETHNNVPVTPLTLRFAATHEALNRSWIFDVLTGLADLIEAGDNK